MLRHGTAHRNAAVDRPAGCRTPSRGSRRPGDGLSARGRQRITRADTPSTGGLPVMTTIDATTLRGDWSYPTRVRFGPGRIGELPDACRALGIARPLLVTDPGLAEHALGRRALEIARAGDLACALFAAIRPNPTGSDVEAGVAALRAGGHDGVIALGGGSALDAAKAIAFMAGQERPLWDFEDRGDNWQRARPEGILPVVAIPTTAGTGSEVGRAAVITNQAVHGKCIVFHPRMLPGQVIADPELTLGLPPTLTAWTGFDALSHSLEALCAPGFHPLADGIATEGIRLVHRWLRRAVEDGADLAARAYMLAAASMGAVAFQKGLGAMHALAHPLGGRLDSHHGLTIAIVMPYVLERNREAIGERLAQLERTLGLTPGGFLGWVTDLRRELGIPPTLATVGMTEDHIAELAPRAAADPSAGGNPLALSADDYAALYRRALAG
jgi:alcohol dehydrogenase class IV